MKQPRVFERSDIVETALELIRRDGWRAVTARNIAKHMGSSTMPIYSHMKSLEMLEHDLKERSRALMGEYQQRTYLGTPLLDTAIGYVAFARDEKNLFRFLYLERPDVSESQDLQSMRDAFYTQFGKDTDRGKLLDQIPAARQEGLIRNSHIFTHGLAMMVNAGILNPDDQHIAVCLSEAGEAFYLLEQQKETRKEVLDE